MSDVSAVRFLKLRQAFQFAIFLGNIQAEFYVARATQTQIKRPASVMENDSAPITVANRSFNRMSLFGWLAQGDFPLLVSRFRTLSETSETDAVLPVYRASSKAN